MSSDNAEMTGIGATGLRDGYRRFAKRLTTLETRISAVCHRTDKLHIVQLRAAVHEVINEMERMTRPSERRNQLRTQALMLLTTLAANSAQTPAEGKRVATTDKRRRPKNRQQRGRSVWTIKGGLPTLGKHH